MASLRNSTIGALLVLLAVSAPAEAGAIKVPPYAGYVTDLAGVLDPDATARLSQLAKEVEGRSTAEIAILIVPSTAPEPIEDYSIAVFDQWKIGKRGKDNGLLFLVAIQDRKLRITTGYGLEGVLPDGKVGEIRDRAVVPFFRAGRYAEGIVSGTEALAAVILGEPGAAAGPRQLSPRSASQRSRFTSGPTGVLLAIFVALVLVSIGLSAADRKSALHGRRPYYRRSGWGPWFGGGAGAGMGGWSGGSGGGFGSGEGFGGFGGGGAGGGGAGGDW